MSQHRDDNDRKEGVMLRMMLDNMNVDSFVQSSLTYYSLGLMSILRFRTFGDKHIDTLSIDSITTSMCPLSTINPLAVRV